MNIYTIDEGGETTRIYAQDEAAARALYCTDMIEGPLHDMHISILPRDQWTEYGIDDDGTRTTFAEVASGYGDDTTPRILCSAPCPDAASTVLVGD